MRTPKNVPTRTKDFGYFHWILECSKVVYLLLSFVVPPNIGSKIKILNMSAFNLQQKCVIFTTSGI